MRFKVDVTNEQLIRETSWTAQIKHDLHTFKLIIEMEF